LSGLLRKAVVDEGHEAGGIDPTATPLLVEARRGFSGLDLLQAEPCCDHRGDPVADCDQHVAVGDQLLPAGERTVAGDDLRLAVREGERALVSLGDSVQVVTPSDYVFMGATRWVHGWRKRGWKKKDGQPVSNLDLWQRLDHMMSGRSVQWVSGKGSPERFKQGLEEAALLAGQALAMEQ